MYMLEKIIKDDEFLRCQACLKLTTKKDGIKHNGCPKCGHRKFSGANSMSLTEFIFFVITHPRKLINAFN